MRVHSRYAVRIFSVLAVIAFAVLPASAQEDKNNNAKAMTPQDVVGFLNQTIAWYRHLAVEQQLATEPAEVFSVNDNRELADQIVRMSFDFARAEAEILMRNGSAAAPKNENTRAVRYHALLRLAANAEKQVKQAQAELDGLRQGLASATGAKRRAIESAIAETQSELELAQTRRDVMRNMLEFISGAGTGSGSAGLHSQIEELERTVPAAVAKPAATGTAQSAPKTTGPITATAGFRTAPSGILALISDLFALSRKGRTLDQSIEMTESLTEAARNLRSPLGGELRKLAQQGDELANRANSSDPVALAEQKKALDNLTAQFKMRSDAVLPLVKQRILLDLYKRSLTNWRAEVRGQYSARLKSLIIRLVLLVLVLAIVFSTSELWRKAIFRYIHDARRRSQLLLFRRIVVWLLIAIIIAFSFATELGSLATFAGLLTAGVAVALQNVILSLAGYFFLIGKYGVRVGDRVQISGVTGEVVDIGLVRLHLMELASGGSDAQPTGRVVVFSNSVVFQPNNGMFKQIPGTNFVWREITLTLAPQSNYRDVEQRLVSAVERVFDEYRESMEGQRRRLESSLGSVTVVALRPQSRLRLTQTGLEVVIRYPVELHDAIKIDDRITRELLDAIEREPKLKLVGTGTPNIQPLEPEIQTSGRAR